MKSASEPRQALEVTQQLLDKSRTQRGAPKKPRPDFCVDAWEPSLLARMKKVARGQYSN